MDSNKNLYEQVTNLWDLGIDSSFHFDFEEECDFETFLGAYYAKAAIAGDCELTDSGIEVVKKSKVQMIEILTENLEDFDESKFE